MLSETKLDDTYTTNQFRIEGFSSPFRADRNAHGGGLPIYVRDNIPSKILYSHCLPDNVEAIFIGLNLKKGKWLLMDNYENLILIGDFNAVNSDLSLTEFREMYTLANLINDPTCYKNPNNPSLIDIILTNRKRSFQYSKTIETGLSDHHKMIITVLKTEFIK